MRVNWGGGVEVGRFGVGVGGGGAQAPLTAPCPPSNHSITINLTLPLQPIGSAMLAVLFGLNKIPKISFMAAFSTSLLSIADPHTNSDPSLGLELGLGLGPGLPSWWNLSWFYNPL